MPIRELDPGAVGGRVRATTILTVRHNGKVVMAGDGQVSVGQTIMKQGARKVRRLHNGTILSGFAGSTADALTLFDKFEGKLQEFNGNLRRAAVEMAKDWRTDRVLRRLEAMLIVSDLDRYIVGQRDAKRAVAIALRNRWRRQNVAPELRDEIAPKNILMIGPTGVGKTEIARRLAKLAQAPFVKVEASRYTEVGYVGRDVESMIRNLAEIAGKMVRDEERERVKLRAKEAAA